MMRIERSRSEERVRRHRHDESLPVNPTGRRDVETPERSAYNPKITLSQKRARLSSASSSSSCTGDRCVIEIAIIPGAPLLAAPSRGISLSRT